jgi:hypothetical protein
MREADAVANGARRRGAETKSDERIFAMPLRFQR